MMDIFWIESLGVIATLVIIASFLTSDLKKIRIWNAVGSVLMIVYGILIHSFSVPFLNLCMVVLQVYKLKKDD